MALKATEAAAIHSQTALLEQQQLQKKEAFDLFLSDLTGNSALGFLSGSLFGVLICGKHKLTRFGALGAGIGAGIALSQCASEFNKIQHREQRVQQWIQEGRDDFQARLDFVQAELQMKEKQQQI